MKFRRGMIEADIVLGGLLLVLSCLGLVFLGSLVAEPKVLLGRSLTAITPALFPSFVLSGLALLSALFLGRRILTIRRSPNTGVEGGAELDRHRPGFLLFAIMIFYALAMKPFGFLLATVPALALVSYLVGNRSPLQIGLVSIVSPILLYLVATRLLAVSLPELSMIEFAYSRLLGE
ncbi:MAG: tripartite tricarboxylate transporter TctB family protein [Geminicoccaceae bacterium]